MLAYWSQCNDLLTTVKLSDNLISPVVPLYLLALCEISVSGCPRRRESLSAGSLPMGWLIFSLLSMVQNIATLSLYRLIANIFRRRFRESGGFSAGCWQHSGWPS